MKTILLNQYQNLGHCLWGERSYLISNCWLDTFWIQFNARVGLCIGDGLCGFFNQQGVNSSLDSTSNFTDGRVERHDFIGKFCAVIWLILIQIWCLWRQC